MSDTREQEAVNIVLGIRDLLWPPYLSAEGQHAHQWSLDDFEVIAEMVQRSRHFSQEASDE